MAPEPGRVLRTNGRTGKRKAIGKASLGNEHLLTVLKEAEAVVNSRPLVYIADDIQSPITLTPAHFLTLNPNIGIPIMEIDEDSEFCCLCACCKSKVW